MSSSSEWNFFPLVTDINIYVYFCLGKNKLLCLLFNRLRHVPRMNMMKMQTSYRETALNLSASENLYLENEDAMEVNKTFYSLWGDQCKLIVALINAQTN